MSPQVENFVHSLVEMAKATELLPEVQRENAQLLAGRDSDHRIIASLQERIGALITEADTLRTQIRSLEVERDDYGFRAMEADDKANAFQRLFETLQTDIRSLVKAVEPPPTSEASTSGEETTAEGSPTPSGAGVPAEVEMIFSSEPVPYAEEQANPFGASTQSSADGPMADSNVSSAVSGSIERPATSYYNRYAGKLFINLPGYVSREEWKWGGGTDETYDWREGDTIPEGCSLVA